MQKVYAPKEEPKPETEASAETPADPKHLLIQQKKINRRYLPERKCLNLEI